MTCAPTCAKGDGARVRGDGYLLAFDFGLQHIGVAVGQTITGTANPLLTLPARNGTPDWGECESLVAQWQPVLLLIGLPLNMDDSESDMSRSARRFARALGRTTGVDIVMVDERLTTFAAKGIAAQTTTHDSHGIAAQLIAETWLNQRR